LPRTIARNCATFGLSACANGRCPPSSAIQRARSPSRAYLVQLGHLAHGDFAHHRAPVGRDGRQPLPLQGAQGIAYRPVADPELGRDVRLDQPLPGREPALDDARSEHPRDALRHGRSEAGGRVDGRMLQVRSGCHGTDSSRAPAGTATWGDDLADY
jgi:hypothetical protein